MVCSKCGAQWETGQSVCAACGEPVGEGLAAQSLTPEASSAQVLKSFKNPEKLTRWLEYLLYSSILMGVLSALSDVLLYGLLEDIKAGTYASMATVVAAAVAADTRQTWVAGIRIGIMLATIVLFAMWIYRAASNTRALGAKDMTFTPGWAVGYYFVPILNWWYPYQAMKEIWKASKAPDAWEAAKRGSVLPWWWLFYLLSGLFGYVVYMVASAAHDIDDLRVALVLMVISSVLSVTSTAIAVVLVRQVHQMQMAHVQRPV
ncbi:DUF4328 domain-containing protein [Dyella sp.]|uniref:DUF4328 domain-containing protein n=1 Tax=Dyella sp. TaxID=1869338 RepID=UPI002D7947E8|nr:DUF4328 domain-containing protein [Dyella sp.]HET7332732.1 DUF4328 domain-containing protein [Dyella sp.]